MLNLPTDVVRDLVSRNLETNALFALVNSKIVGAKVFVIVRFESISKRCEWPGAAEIAVIWQRPWRISSLPEKQ